MIGLDGSTLMGLSLPELTQGGSRFNIQLCHLMASVVYAYRGVNALNQNCRTLRVLLG